MMRIALFLLTNIAVLVVISLLFSLLGIGGILDEQGVDLDLGALLVYSAVIGFTGSFISLALSKFMAKRATGAQVIDESAGGDAAWLVRRVRTHASAAGIGMPEVAVFPADEPNAFATGMRRDAALVAVSTGLLQSMDRGEIDAVLGHEIAHIENGDMITLTLIQGVLNTFVVFLSRIVGHVVDRVVLKNERGHGIGFWVATIAAQILLGILASIIVAWFSRRREFRADAGGARLAGRENMIAALERLKGGTAELPDGMAAFGIGGGGMLAAFSTHPPLDVRIAALRADAA
ncbi:MAG: protease HtpX [Deltaproteobacteria bacterium]|jgi:heat shock protein HtpX|nr:protease HtpX [Deltaproteobacteria bacterium]